LARTIGVGLMRLAQEISCRKVYALGSNPEQEEGERQYSAVGPFDLWRWENSFSEKSSPVAGP